MPEISLPLFYSIAGGEGQVLTTIAGDIQNLKIHPIILLKRF